MSSRLRYVDLPEELRRRALAPVLTAVAKTWLLILAAIAACSAYPSAGLWFAGAVMIGVLQYHLNILGHDGIHYNLSADRRLNERVSRWVLLGPQGLSLGAMRRNHLNHHLTLGDPGDLDRHYYDLSQYPSRERFLRWLLEAPFGGVLIALVRKLSHHSLEAKDVPQVRSESRIDLISVVSCQASIALALWLATAKPWAYLPLWAIPLVTVMVGLNSIRSCLEHADLPKSSQPYRDHSFLSNRFERFFLAPFNMNFHAEHHQFVGIPFHRLPALRDLLLNAGEDGIRWEKSYWSRFRYLWNNFDSSEPSARARGDASQTQGLKNAADQEAFQRGQCA